MNLFFYIQKGFDVFNALDLMENKTFLEKLKFGIGDGNLQYYLYNWKCPSMGSEKVRHEAWHSFAFYSDWRAVRTWMEGQVGQESLKSVMF